MAKKKDNPNLVTMAEYAKRRGVHYSLIKRYAAQGRLTRYDGKIDITKADDELNATIDVTHKSKSKLKTDDSVAIEKNRDPISFNDAKAKREMFKANLAELEYREKAGELISVSVIEKEAEDMYRKYRDKMLNVVIRA